MHLPLLVAITLPGGDVEPFMTLGCHGDVSEAGKVVLEARLLDGKDKGAELCKLSRSEVIRRPLTAVVGKPLIWTARTRELSCANCHAAR
jgi:hypothetical protein